MAVARRHQDDAVPEADPLRALRAGGEEDLGRRGVRVLLEEVVLDLPRVVEAEPVGELHLRERVLEQPLLVPLAPRPRQLVLVEHAELHDFLLRSLHSLRAPRTRRLQRRRMEAGARKGKTRRSLRAFGPPWEGDIWL